MSNSYLRLPIVYELQFTVIISTYFRPDYLYDLVESIFLQTLIPFEVIIIEGGDEEALQKVHKRLSKWKDKIAIYHYVGCTLGRSRNFGVELAKGNWCVFADDDDLWHPDKLHEIARLAPNSDVISHFYHVAKNPKLGDFNRLPIGGKAIQRSSYSLFLHFLGNRYGGGSSLTARTVICKAIRFDEKMRSCEDIDWILRCLFSGSRMSFIKIPLVIYRQHSQRMTNNQKKVAKWEIFMIKRFIYIPIGLLFGFAIKSIRITVRIIFSR